MKILFCLVVIFNILFISNQVLGQTNTVSNISKTNQSDSGERLQLLEQCLVKLIQESEEQRAKKDKLNINGNIQFYSEYPNKTTAFGLKPKYNIGQQILLIFNGNIHEDMGLLVAFKQNACWGKWGEQYTETELPFKIDEAYVKVRKFNGIATIGRQYFKVYLIEFVRKNGRHFYRLGQFLLQNDHFRLFFFRDYLPIVREYPSNNS